MRIGRPAVDDFGEADLFFAQGLAVRFLGVLAMGRAIADVAVNDDQRRALGLFQCGLDGAIKLLAGR